MTISKQPVGDASQARAGGTAAQAVGGPIAPHQDETAAQAAAAWKLGDYHRFSRTQMWERGAELVRECRVKPGERVLDVAAGSGNVAIQAAAAGARATASDLTDANFAAGRREARALGVELDWIRADAQELPFEAASFDVVCSSFGVMFAPDHGRAAAELLRVCRPGGRIGLSAFTPEGLAVDFFALLAPHLPPPAPGAAPPLAWGSEEHVRELLGRGVSRMAFSRRVHVESAPGAPEYARLFRETFGPVVAVRGSLDGERLAAFDAELDAYAARNRSGPAEGPAHYAYEYLLTVAERGTPGTGTEVPAG